MYDSLFVGAQQAVPRQPRRRQETWRTVLGVGTSDGLGRCQPNLANPSELDVLLCLPKVIVVLHGKPTLRRTTKRLRKAQGHFRADAASSLQDAIQRGSGHSELCGKFATTKVVRLKINLGDELAGMGGDCA